MYRTSDVTPSQGTTEKSTISDDPPLDGTTEQATTSDDTL
jgi:hypothetical protein